MTFVVPAVILLAGPTSTSTTLVPGAHQDAPDLYGPLLALAAILGAIAVVRVVFRAGRRRGGSASPGPGPGAAADPPGPPAAGDPP